MFPEFDIKNLIRLAAAHDPEETRKILNSIEYYLLFDDNIGYGETDRIKRSLKEAYYQGYSEYNARPSSNMPVG
jgi:hypothetical protein